MQIEKKDLVHEGPLLSFLWICVLVKVKDLASLKMY